MRTVFILSISSDIGFDLGRRYLALGFKVIGTYRNDAQLNDLRKNDHCVLIKCDVSKPSDIKRMALRFKKDKLCWDVFISCVGHPLPVVSFFESDFLEWADSVNTNALAQLHALHALYPFRNRKISDVILFAGGGMNGAVKDFSAYTVSKIMLAKMCEFLDAENKDLNIFIVGPGWTKTKIHKTILKDKRTSKGKVLETKEFLKAKAGTSLNDIFESIEWLRAQGKGIVSGRNFSIVYDPWRKEKRANLVKALINDANMYKLRRQGNGFLQ